MARKRMVHPSMFTDSKFLQLKDEAKILFIGMLCFADDEGIFKNDAISIKCQVIPMSSAKLGLIEDYIRTIVELNLWLTSNVLIHSGEFWYSSLINSNITFFI